jgi:hypothetical protein
LKPGNIVPPLFGGKEALDDFSAPLPALEPNLSRFIVTTTFFLPPEKGQKRANGTWEMDISRILRRNREKE